MSVILSAWLMVMRRSAANWRLLCSIVLGVLVAVTLLASTPIYADALHKLGLSYTLHRQDANAMNIQILTYYYPLQRGEYDKLAASVQGFTDGTLGWLTDQTIRRGKSATFYVFKEGQPRTVERMTPRGYFQFSTGMEDHVSIVDGRLPKVVSVQPGTPDDQLPEFEVALGRSTADDLKIKVGDLLDFMSTSRQVELPVRVVGIVEPVNLEGTYWAGNKTRFAERAEEYVFVPSFVPEETLFRAVGEAVPRIDGDFSWFLLLNIDKITTENASRVGNDLRTLRAQLKSTISGSLNITLLDEVIREYESKIFFLTVPLFLVIVQIVGIVLFYLVMVASVLVERQAGEMALLKSRGGSMWQILSFHAMESLMICGIAAVLGPPLAVLLISLLGKTPPFLPLTQGELLAASLPPNTFLFALAAAGMCFLALILPAFQAARMGIIQYKLLAARPPRVPWWQRYYLDLALLVLGGILYWELRERGAFVAKSVSGNLSSDPLLLISPALFVIAVATILLRLFPMAMSLLAKAFTPFVSASVVLGLYQMVRNPVHYTRLILLLMLTTSLGIFFATFGATLERSYKERALYDAGADFRMENLAPTSDKGKEALIAEFGAISGVTGVSPVFRSSSGVGSGRYTEDFTLLAVEPSSIARLTWFREDFSRSSFAHLIGLLEEDRVGGEGKEIAGQPEKFGVWALSTDPRQPLSLYVRVKDARGVYFDFGFGALNSAEWRYMEAPVKGPQSQPPPSFPLRLHSVYVRNESSAAANISAASVYLDDLQATGAAYANGGYVLDDFEDVGDWAILQESPQPSTDTWEATTEKVHGGKTAGKFAWAARRTFGVRGVRVTGEDKPVTVIASDGFLRSSGRRVGDYIQMSLGSNWFPAVIQDSVNLFPTIDPGEGGFVLVNLDRVLYTINQASVRRTYPNEVWLSLTPEPETRAEAVKALRGKQSVTSKVREFNQVYAEYKSDPLIAAGWGGVLFIAFLASLLLSAIGFLVYSYLSIQKRVLDFAILRTMGLSRGQLVGLICFEQLTVVLTGIIAGTVFGARLGTLMMPFLELTEKGRRVLPPYALEIEWGTVLVTYGILSVVFASAITVTVYVLNRLAVHTILRMGNK